MKKVLLALLIVLFALPATDALAKRKHVRIYKPSPPQVSTQPAVALAAVPPIAVAFDLARRLSCDPAIAVSTGPGDPGFDPAGPQVGNFIIPAINRPGVCPRPEPRRRRG